jgi:CRP-like cAMP-binding protein
MAEVKHNNQDIVQRLKGRLQNLVPLNALTQDNFEALLQDIQVLKVPAGKTIFKAGSTDNRNVYLLSGDIVLLDAAGKSVMVRGGSDQARHPIGNQRPRRYSAIVKTDAVIAHMDRDQLDTLLTWDQSSGYEVQDVQQMEQQGDWMTQLLNTKSLSRLPAANIQTLFMKVEQIEVKAGEDVIRQGDEGDYYYIVRSGICRVTRTSPKTGEQVILDKIGAGESFGEEALISDRRRNATITMVTDGKLMRLAKEDFLALLKEPMVKWLEFDDAISMVKDGAVLLDVRLPSEYENENLPGSINIPLVYLRRKMNTLDKSRAYVIYCDTGRRSSSAAFLMSERDFDVYVLNEGMNGRSPADAA